MTDCYKPRDECGLSSAIKDAATAKMPLVVRGAGSKSAMGRPTASSDVQPRCLVREGLT